METAALKSHLDTLFSRAVAGGHVPGVIAIATDRTSVLYEGAFGHRVLGQEAPMTVDTVAWIASMTKAVTAAAAMQLVEQGKLSLDTPAARIIPSLGEVQILEGYDATGKPRFRAPRTTITLRHLLTHTAGFSYDIWNAELARYMAETGIPGIISCLNAAMTTPLMFEPGTRWDYGINIDWAGKMIEAVSGQTLGAYLDANIFKPLGMKDSGFKIRPELRGRLAKIHQRDADGTLVPQLELEIPQEPEFEMGGGGLYSTAPDYLQFVRMILNDGRSQGQQVLKPETVAEMTRNNIGDIRVTNLKTVIPPLSNDAEFFPGTPKGWGLSFQVNLEQAPTGRPAGGLMWAGLANSYYWIDRTSGIGGVYITQIMPFADEKSLALYYAFESAFYAK